MILAVSRMEYSLDELLFTCSRRYRQQAQILSPTYPVKSREKIDVLIGFLLRVAPLRTQPISSDGDLNLNSLGYAIEEIFAERNAIAHGASWFQETTNGRTVFHFQKYTRTSRNAYTVEKFLISDIGLNHLADRADFFRGYLEDLTRFVEGKGSWEQDYKVQRQISDNWKMFQELGIAILDPETNTLKISFERD